MLVLKVAGTRYFVVQRFISACSAPYECCTQLNVTLKVPPKCATEEARAGLASAMELDDPLIDTTVGALAISWPLQKCLNHIASHPIYS